MAIEVRTYTKVIPANSEADIVSITPSEGETYLIKEVVYKLAGAGTITKYFEERKMDEINYELHPNIDNPLLISEEIPVGKTVKWVGKDTSGSNNKMSIMLTYDKTYA
jgi:hypothetical protein